jgi:biopolymer transport protein ExbB
VSQGIHNLKARNVNQRYFFCGWGCHVSPISILLLAIALILERIAFWQRVTKRQNRITREVLKLYPYDPQAAFLKLEQNSDLPIARVFLAALELEQPTPEEFRLALESAAQAELPILNRFSTVFETIIGASPLLGLLGTILGLIASLCSSSEWAILG